MKPRQSALRKLACAASVAAFIASGSIAHGAEIVLKVGTSWNDQFPMSEVLKGVLKPMVEKYSDGRMSLDIHMGKALCSQKTCVEQVKLGQTDIGTASAANYGGFHKTYEVLTLPYIFKDDASAQKVLDDFLFETLDKISIERDKMKVLAVVPFLGCRMAQSTGLPRLPDHQTAWSDCMHMPAVSA